MALCAGLSVSDSFRVVLCIRLEVSEASLEAVSVFFVAFLAYQLVSCGVAAS